MINIETFQEKESALAQLAKYSETTLNSFKVIELRVMSQAIISNNTQYKKPELIALILEATETYKSAIATEIKKEIGDSIVSDDFISLIKNYFKNKKSPIELAIYLKSQLIEKTSENGNGFTVNTLGKTKVSELKKAVELVKKELVNSENFCNAFYNELYYGYLKQFEKRANVTYFAGINAVKTVDDKVKLNGQKILSWAVETIESAVSKGEQLTRGWYPLSLALAVTSGRRMDELHGETVHADKGIKRYYELRENNKIFISQLAKNPENTSFIFTPIGVSAEDWLTAHELLPETSLGLTEDKVNKVISSNIGKSPAMKKLYTKLGLNSFKDSRDFYIVYRLTVEYKTGLSAQFDRESDFVQSIIGHSSKASGHSYESFVIV